MLTENRVANPARFAIFVFCITCLAYSLLLPYVYKNWKPTGDEPHYLLMAQSLVLDHDLDLANDYADSSLDAHIGIGADGKWRPMHSPGLPFLLAVPWYLGDRLAVLLFFNVIAALIAANTYLLAYEMSGNRRTGILAWLVTAFTPPMAIYAFLIYPDMVGALLMLWALRRVRGAVAEYESRHAWSWVLLGCVLAFLPWLVLRFAPAAALLVLAALGTTWSAGRASRHQRIQRCLCLLAPAVISGILYLVYQFMMYGSFSPVANFNQTGISVGIPGTMSILEALFGWFLDQRSGLLCYAPVFALALPGCLFLIKEKSRGNWLLIAVVAVHLLSLSLIGFWAQWSPPTRYLVFIVPLLGIGIAFALHYSRTRMVGLMSLVLLALGLINAWVTFTNPILAYSKNFCRNQLLPAYTYGLPFDVRNLLPLFGHETLFKDKRVPGGSVLRVVLGAETLQADRGEVVKDPRASSGICSFAAAGQVQAGTFLNAGTGANVMPGSFWLFGRMRLGITAHREAVAAILEVWGKLNPQGSRVLLARRAIYIRDFTAGGEYQRIGLQFENPLEQELSLRVDYPAQASLYVDYLALQPITGIWQSWGLGGVWLGAIALFAVYCFTHRTEPSTNAAACRTAWAESRLAIVISTTVLIGWNVYLFARADSRIYESESMYHATGVILPDADASGKHALRKAQADPAGALVYGPYAAYKRGEYSVTFRLKLISRHDPDAIVALLDVAGNVGKSIWAKRALTMRDFPSPGEYCEFTLDLVLPREKELEFRVLAADQVELWADCVRIQSVR